MKTFKIRSINCMDGITYVEFRCTDKNTMEEITIVPNNYFFGHVLIPMTEEEIKAVAKEGRLIKYGKELVIERF